MFVKSFELKLKIGVEYGFSLFMLYKNHLYSLSIYLFILFWHFPH